MTKKILVAGLILTFVLALSGCNGDEPRNDSSATQTPASSFSESKETSELPEETSDEKKASSEVVIQTETPSPEEPVELQETVKPQETPKQTETQAQKPESTASQSSNEPAYEQSTPQKSEEVAEPSTPSKPTETKPAEPETTPTPTPTPTPKPEPIPEETKPEPEQPKFDVNEWISYARNYAQSIGLTLDETAVYCWDNPITANAKRTQLESDIVNRLNRYKTVEGFTAVWIWAEKVSDTEWDLYIGYA